MRVIQLITHMHELGGAQMHVFDLSKALKSNGHDVVLLGSGNCELTEELYERGINYRELKWMGKTINPIRDISAFFEVRKAFKEINPEMVAIHSSKAGIIGRIAAKSLRIPVIFTAHSWSFTGVPSNMKRRLYTWIEKLVGKITDGVITVSAYDYNEAVKHRIISGEKLHMIHNGIVDDARCYRPGVDPEPTVRLLMVARFAEPKDHQLLLKALSQITAIPWHLTLVGDGPLLGDMQQLAAQLDIENQITFAGEDRDVIGRMQEADIFLLISKSEGLPLSIIEAMREGLPVIASEAGGISELIEHGRQGFIVEQGDESALITALQQLMASESLRERFGQAARTRFIGKFNFEKMYRQTEAFYREITEKSDIEKREEII